MLALIKALDPDGEPGRLTLITRMGAGRIRQALPPLAEAVAASTSPKPTCATGTRRRATPG